MDENKSPNKFKVTKCPNDELSLQNCVIVNEDDFPEVLGVKHITVNTGGGANFVFSIKRHPSIPKSHVGFSLPQRKWAVLSLNQEVQVDRYYFKNKIFSIVFDTDFVQKKTVTQDSYDTEEMATDFRTKFKEQIFTVGQQLAFQFNDTITLLLVVKDIEVISKNAKDVVNLTLKKGKIGLLYNKTNIQFVRAANSSLILTGKNGVQVQQRIFNSEWDLTTMGIGGLTNEFNNIFRRAFASRIFPQEIVRQLGCKHVKGILLYGPPGTGKTLMARQIGKMLNTREPKIVNGPQILDKYVGESEANIRRLFADAEEEEKKAGANSELHIIIFDEIDAICKRRGSVAGNTGVHDTVVNQLLSKIDGVEQLNNILVIGMTNRRDMIDDALLRPGRLEVQVEMSLPNEEGRIEILNIHTALMKRFKKISPDVDIKELATLTKNYSGAELEGLVRAGLSVAMNRSIDAPNIAVNTEIAKKLLVTRADFIHAWENDIKPAFGTAEDILKEFVGRGIINWGPPVTSILEDGMLSIQQARATDTSGLVSVLIEGPPNAGKTALAGKLAKDSDFPFVKICSPEEMVGFTETAKCFQIKKEFDDAYRSPLSCIIVDNIERLLDYGPIGPRYSNLTLQALLVLVKKQPPPGKKLLVLCTTSRKQVLEEMEMLSAFTTIIHVPNLTKPKHLLNVLETSQVFTDEDLNQIKDQIGNKRIFIGIKKLLWVIDMVRQIDGSARVAKFISKLEEGGALENLEIA